MIRGHSLPICFFSTDVTDDSGGVIIFIRQSLSFSELSTSSLSSLNPYSDYVEVNISLNDSTSLSYLNVYAPSISSSPKDSKTNFFPPFFPPMWKPVEFSRFRIPGPNYTFLLRLFIFFTQLPYAGTKTQWL